MSKQDKLIIAVPSKGRLQEKSGEFFKKLGLKLNRTSGARGYVGVLDGIEGVDIAYLSASEIAKALDEGKVHLGITGEDLVRENIRNADDKVNLLYPLGFGHADVIVAAPKAWIDVNDMMDLDEVAHKFRERHGSRMRIATKYNHLTANFFASHGVENYRLVPSAGATEGAPAAGSAELIVDITSTGSTLEANNLKILDDGIILKSQANLVLSYQANWSEANIQKLKRILSLVDAETFASKHQEVDVAIDENVEVDWATLENNFGAKAAFGKTSHGGKLTLIAPKKNMFDLVAYFETLDCEYVCVKSLDFGFNPKQKSHQKLLLQLAKFN